MIQAVHADIYAGDRLAPDRGSRRLHPHASGPNLRGELRNDSRREQRAKAKLLQQVEPVYPPLALQARIRAWCGSMRSLDGMERLRS